MHLAREFVTPGEDGIFVLPWMIALPHDDTMTGP